VQNDGKVQSEGGHISPLYKEELANNMSAKAPAGLGGERLGICIDG
jgi:hypothetical protein